ncbi:AN1-like Zinc finger family protein [Leishmania donovani]|uniref:AN1-like Zinc finger family protein n=1 Tax=Leishmania donovani TaxID=5661 RepID=A0A504XXE4_LEIDO|nr:AN1-like Zinc finger family protein [Leishmania donovani]TPP53231.1 AN1-like Zinc finger family protein [Leishmania donovani]TPP55242.1 AN1-like Zinc finger family protein [Leishmania donovani]
MQVGVYDRDDQMCQYEGCTEIDLLPARCSNCDKRFCTHHLSHNAHHCPAVTDVRVGTCPICYRVVPLEYPRQRVDEAVSRHIDRGCRDVPQGSLFYGGAVAKGRPGQASGRRLGGPIRPCSIQGCHEASETRVKYRDAGMLVSLPGDKAASVACLLTHPANTPEKAVGKATELPSDMVTCLVCFLIPTSVFKKDCNAGCEEFEPVPSFFMFMPKNTALGRLLDTAVDRAAMSSPAVRTGKPWNLFAVTLPIHAEAEAAYYSPLPLSTVVRKSVVGMAERTIVFLSPLQALPESVIKVVKDLDRKGSWPSPSLSSSQGCQVM